MPRNTRTLVRLSCAILAGVSLATLSTSQPQAQYKLTVNRERLLNAQNEPQNWLMMNGDYSSQRY
jgi:alcohol dehydrogenase (cytochrome c)